MVFWIEHVVSNFNWLMHISSLMVLAVAFSMDPSTQGFFSVIFYFVFSLLTYFVYYTYGTAAIRYLNNDYWADEYLLPSILYRLGLVKHQIDYQFDYYSDPTAVDDIPIENWDSDGNF